MRSALLLAGLLVSSALALGVAVPTASAAPCGGVVDVACDSSYCNYYFGLECARGQPTSCVVYVNPPVLGGYGRAPLVCVVV